jgi:hypothetical protein
MVDSTSPAPPEITGAECPEHSECIKDRSSPEALAQRTEAIRHGEYMATLQWRWVARYSPSLKL